MMPTDGSGADSTDLIPSNGHDGSSKGRTRVSRACTRCRTRKDKCNGHEPCSNCLGAHQPCSYEPATKKRGLPEGYVRGLEKLWAILINKIEGLDDAVARLLVDNQGVLADTWNQHQLADGLHTIWKESKVLQELENLLETAPITHGKRKREPDSGEESTPGSVTSELFLRLEPQFHVQILDVFGAAHDGELVDNRMILKPQQPVQLPSAASQLLSHYFTYTHCWYPILDRPYSLKKCYEYSKTPELSAAASSDLAMLWAVFAYTSHQMLRANEHVGLGRPHFSVAEMSRISYDLIPFPDGPFEIGHVQALLILTLLEIGLDNYGKAWILVGHAQRIAAAPMTRQSPSQMRGISVMQGSFILDNLIALRLNRKPHCRRDEMSAYALMDEDGHEEWEPWNTSSTDAMDIRGPAFSISCFNRLTELVMILNDCICFDEATGTTAQEHYTMRLQELGDLEKRYPFSTLKAEQRPPHQLFLQLAHLSLHTFVSCKEGKPSVSSMLGELLPRMCLVWENGINVPAITFNRISPILAGFFRPMLQTVSLARDTFTHPLECEYYDAFMSKLSNVFAQAGIIWPAFEVCVQLSDREVAKPRSVVSQMSSAHHGDSAKRHKGPSKSIPNSNLNLWPADPFAALPAANAGGSLSAQHSIIAPETQTWNGRSSSYGQSPTLMSGNFEIGRPRPANNTYQDVNIEMSGLEHSEPPGILMPASNTSPSFQGDEIDALFHEMAHLDTTEWTNGRSQALRDFGFTDDGTFEEFCNDPDRLFSNELVAPQRGFGSQAGSTTATNWSPMSTMRQPSAPSGPSGDAGDFFSSTWAQ